MIARVCAFVVFFAACAPLDASATFDVKAYRHSKSVPATKVIVSNYLSGLRDGILLFDGYRHRYEKVALAFCLGDKDLSGDNIVLLVERELADPANGTPYPDDMPIVFVLIKALERFVPCTKDK